MSRAILLASLAVPLMVGLQSGAATDEGPRMEILSVQPISRDVVLNNAYDVHVVVENAGAASATGRIYAYGRPFWWDIADQYPWTEVSLAPGERATVVVHWSSSVERLVRAGETGPTEFAAASICDAWCVADEEYAPGLYPVWMPGPPIVV